MKSNQELLLRTASETHYADTILQAGILIGMTVESADLVLMQLRTATASMQEVVNRLKGNPPAKESYE